MIEFITENWIPLLLGLIGFAEIVVRLTPTKKDDSILNFIIKIVDFLIPNIKDGGGKHN